MRVANTPRDYIPNPWFADEYYVSQIFQFSWSTIASTVWPAANRAIYVPCTFPADCTLYSISFRAMNGLNNYDLGFYNAAGTRLAVSGSTAMSAAGTKTLTLPDIRVYAGDQYYAALVLSGTTGIVWGRAPSTATALVIVGAGQEALGGTALPATMTPAAPASTMYPLFWFGVR